MSAPLPAWLKGYGRSDLGRDLAAGAVVALLLVPQGLAFAALAGLPPQLGLYASLLPLLAYAFFASSRVLSVGPVAVTSLMTAAALTPLAGAGLAMQLAGAAALALFSGAMLFAFGLLRLGVLAQFLSHPVISGFITGAAVLIVLGQLRPLLGIEAPAAGGGSAVTLLAPLIQADARPAPFTAAVGLASLILLWAARSGLPAIVVRAGGPLRLGELVARLSPIVIVVAAALLVAALGWEDRLRVIGALPSGLPVLAVPQVTAALLHQLWLPALLIGLVAFVESVAVAQAFAGRDGRRVDANAELRGLGAANLASAFSGAFPLAGSLSRTAINAEAGARTPLAGIFAAILIALILLFATGLFRTLPETVLAATIIVIALGLVDVRALQRTWRYDRVEAMALAGTVAGVLLGGVETGLALGIGLSLAALVWRASRPHIAVVGRVAGTEHFRNVERHEVETATSLLMLRVDEILFFGNAEAVERRIEEELARRPRTRHLVLLMSAIGYVDATALGMMRDLNERLKRRDIALHLAEVKGPVLDRLRRDRFLDDLGGEVHLSAWAAFERLRQAGA